MKESILFIIFTLLFLGSFIAIIILSIYHNQYSLWGNITCLTLSIGFIGVMRQLAIWYGEYLGEKMSK